MGCVRMHHQEQVHFITNRCEQEQFLLIPHERINELIIEWLARALTFVEGNIEIYAYIFLSNHFHLLLKDTGGKLAQFMGYFQGNLARAVNRDLERHGKFWAREYDDTLVEGDADFIDRYLYTTCNGVKAGLVNRAAEWGGVCSLEQAKSGESIEVQVINRSEKYRLTRHGKTVDPSLYTETHWLTLTDPPMWNGLEQKLKAHLIETLVSQGEHGFRNKRENRPALGMAIVLGCHYTDRPEEPARRPRRKAFSLDQKKEQTMLEAIHLHNAGYRETYAAFVTAAMAGKRPTVQWPNGSYPPSCAEPAALKN